MIIKLQISWPALALLRPVEVLAGLPAPFSLAKVPYKCLWALHCSMESAALFFDRLDCAALVEQEKIAIIAPSLGNGYFINTPGERQGAFLEELFGQLPHTLPISTAREDNAVIGISMGAFGAVRWALDSCKFHIAAAISGVFDCHVPDDSRLQQDRQLKALHGTFRKIMRSCLLDTDEKARAGADLAELADRVSSPPDIVLYCGEEDYISLNQTQWLLNLLQSRNMRVNVHTSPGRHDMSFWKRAFREAVTDMFHQGATKPHAVD